MSESGSRSWDEAIDTLRRAIGELRAAVGREGPASPDEEAAAQRLKVDVSRLEQSAADLRAKVTSGFDTRRAEFESAFDRERAEQAGAQIRSAVDELAGLARSVAVDVKSAAQSTFTHAEPELKTAISALEDVAASTAAWVKAIIDPEHARRDEPPSGSKPPLDDL